MLRNALIVLILMLLALGVADARMPEVGDHVVIYTSSSNSALVSYLGDITDIGDGLICLHGTGGGDNNPHDMCIGVGSIVRLVWK
jgi:hypothetical protein